MSSITPPPVGAGRLAQFRYSYQMTSAVKPLFGVSFVLATLAGAAVGALSFYWLPFSDLWRNLWMVIGAIVIGFSAGSFVFLKMAQSSAYYYLRDQLGGAAGATGMLNKSWKTTQAVAFTRGQDLVHRVVGPPGVILVGEGDPHRLRSVMIDERKRLERVLGVTPVHTVYCGDGEGQVPIESLNKHLIKLGRNIRPAEMTEVLNRLKAMDATRNPLPIPKGPIPGMKGLRSSQRGR